MFRSIPSAPAFLTALGLATAHLLAPLAQAASEAEDVGATTQTGGPTDAEVLEHASTLRDGFLEAIRYCGIEPRYHPDVRIENHPGLVSFFWQGPDQGHVALSTWQGQPEPVRGLLHAWAAHGTLGMSPEQLFNEIFQRLALPHELGHYLQHMSGRIAGVDRWTSELEANRIAIAFWQNDPDTADGLPQRIENFTTFLASLPDPLPEGADARSWFNENYNAIGGDSEIYGWFQGRLMQEAWRLRDEHNFCELATALTLPASDG
jgi:hypothetical protein